MYIKEHTVYYQNYTDRLKLQIDIIPAKYGQKLVDYIMAINYLTYLV